MLELLKTPEAIAFGLMLVAVAVPHIFGYLKAKATKTTTMADDEFLAAIETMINSKLDAKKKK